MRVKDSLELVGIPVKDIYGREIGEFNGYTLDIAGNVRSIGVESCGNLLELPGSSILSAKKEIVILPEWKAEGREWGFEREVLETKVASLGKMLENGEISQRIYDGMYESFVAKGQKREVLLQKLSRRLEQLQRNDDGIDLFLTRVKMQTDDALSSAASFATIRAHCTAIKSANENEREDLKSMQELVQSYLGRKTELAAPGPQEDELVIGSDEERPMEQAQHPQEEAEEAAPRGYGQLRSLSTQLGE